jgi:hypothetical protein
MKFRWVCLAKESRGHRTMRFVPVVAIEEYSPVPAPDEHLTMVRECLRGCRTRARHGFYYDDHHANAVRSEPATSRFQRRHWLTMKIGGVICQAEKTTGCGSV